MVCAANRRGPRTEDRRDRPREAARLCGDSVQPDAARRAPGSVGDAAEHMGVGPWERRPDLILRLEDDRRHRDSTRQVSWDWVGTDGSPQRRGPRAAPIPGRVQAEKPGNPPQRNVGGLPASGSGVDRQGFRGGSTSLRDADGF